MYEDRCTNNSVIRLDLIKCICHCCHAFCSLFSFYLFSSVRACVCSIMPETDFFYFFILLYYLSNICIFVHIHPSALRSADLCSALYIMQHVTAASPSACFGSICHCSHITGLQNPIRSFNLVPQQSQTSAAGQQ